jgi:hypothetical protein
MKMKKNNVPELVGNVLKDIGETPDTAGWDCHGTFVLLHKALERVAAHKKITFDAPTIVESDINSKNVVIIVTGHLGDKSEWSFGEAAPYNNKNAYPFAMAEKRAKDRVILKLVGLHGHVYSEEEADDFKKARPVSISDTPVAVNELGLTISEDQVISIKKLIIETKIDEVVFLEWAKVEKIEQISAEHYDHVFATLEERKREAA